MKTIMIKGCLFTSVVLLSLGRTYALPVVSELGIIAGDRGVALSVGADAGFEAEFTGDNNNVTITCKRCISGLSQPVYDSFPVNSPVSRMTVRETSGLPMTIVITLKSNVSLPIKTIQKNGQWIALVSNGKSAGYTWTNASKQAAPTAVAAEKQPAATMSAVPATLKNVRLLERGQVCELAFEFDKKVTGQVKRDKNMIRVTVNGAVNGVGSEALSLPKNSVFQKVTLKATNAGNQQVLETSFTIDTSGTSPDFNVAFMQGEVLSLFLAKKKNSKATLWTSGHGLTVDHPFYDVPSYTVDMAFIEKRAIEDAARRLSRVNTFSITEAYNSLTATSVPAPVPENVNKVSPPEVAVPEVVEPVQKETAPERKSVALANVNIRSGASIKSDVRGKLFRGDTVGLTEENGKWSRITVNGKIGYVYTEYLRPAIPEIAQTDRPEIAAPASENSTGTAEDDGITKVSTTASAFATESSNDLMGALTSNELISPIHDIPALRSKTIEYRGAGRDPFMPIQVDSMSASEYPTVENLSLVGVLIDNYDRIALCEENKNSKRPFALREQDQVFKGKVLKIFKDKVVFLLTEYGISRSYTLTFAKNVSDKEASLK